MSTLTTDELVAALANLVLELQLRAMHKEQVLDMARIARRLTVNAERRLVELQE